jgi:hypothetical protein
VTVGVALLGHWLGYKLGEIIDEKTKGGFRWWAKGIAEGFVNALVQAINYGMDKANVLSFLGVSAPNISEVHLRTPQEEIAHGAHITHPFPGAHAHVSPPGAKGPTGHGKASGPAGPAGPTNRRNVIENKINVYLDGKQIAENVAHHAQQAAALA